MHATIARALEQQVRLLYLLPSSSWNLGIFLLPLLLLLLLLPLVLLLLNFFNQEAAISSMLSLSLPPQPPYPTALPLPLSIPPLPNPIYARLHSWGQNTVGSVGVRRLWDLVKMKRRRRKMELNLQARRPPPPYSVTRQVLQLEPSQLVLALTHLFNYQGPTIVPLVAPMWTSALLHRPNRCFLHAPKRPPILFIIRLQGEASAAVMATGNRSWITTGCCSATRCRPLPTWNRPHTLCHSLLPPSSPGNGEGRSICVQTEAAPSPLLMHSSPPPPSHAP